LSRESLDGFAWHRPGGAPPRTVPGITWQGVDLLDRNAVRTALDQLRPAWIFHCAGAAHVGRSWDSTEETYAVNVRGTHNVVESLRECEIRARVLIPSSAMVYAPSGKPLREADPLVPSSPYGLSKLAQELVASDPEAPERCVVARAFNHLGPRQDPRFAASQFARRIAEIEAGLLDAEIAVGNLDARRDLTDVRDTVRAYRLILEHGTPGRTYNVCSGRAVAIGELLDLLLSRSQIRIRIRLDPARFRPNDLPLVLGDPTRLATELGWRAEIPLEQTADDLLDFWRAQVVA
jgi:GDP-4-dehydro-6-deoxy-D-mannose reductase